MADRIVVLKDGAVQQIGTPRELYEQPCNRFVAGFVGTPSMNILDGSIMPDGTVAIADGPALATDLAGLVSERTFVSVGIRPTDISLEVGTTPTVAIEGRVERTEYGGSDAFWDCSLGACPLLRVRVSPYATAAADGRVNLFVSTDQLHLFGRDGERLNIGSARR